MRRLSLMVGVLLSLGAMVGYFLLGTVLNPPPVRVVVVVQDVPAGTILDSSMLGVDAQRMDSRIAQRVVKEGDLPRVIGKSTSRPLVKGQPLMYADVILSGNPAARERVSRALERPGTAAMSIPVGENAPEIGEGDRIAIVMSVQGWTLASTAPGASAVSPAPSSAGTAPETASAVPGTVAVPGIGSLPPEVASLLMPSIQSTQAQMGLISPFQPPASKVVACGEVVSVQRKREMNPAYTGAAGQSPYIETSIPERITVVVPEQMVEAVSYAIHGEQQYDIVVLSPNTDPEEGICQQATWGVHWPDLVAYFVAARMAQQGMLPEALQLPGAANLYGGAVQMYGMTTLWTLPSLTGTLPLTSAFPLTSTPLLTSTGSPALPVSPTPLPPVLPTATPAAAPSPTPPEPARLPGTAWTSLLAGLGCLAILAVLVVAAVFALFRKRGR